MKIETNIHSIENAFWNVFSSSYLLLVLGLRIQRMNSLVLTNDLSSGNIQKLNSSTSVGDPNLNITLVGSEVIYDIFREYDFFVPEVDVVCQCGCTDDRRKSCRPLDVKCAQIVNSTTTCTNYITVDNDSSICNKYYKLCCQVYFTRTKMMKTFKALHLKYRQTIFTINMDSQSPGTKTTTHNVTERVTRLLVSHERVLDIQAKPLRLLPDKWYFIEYGTNELFHSEQMNAIDELNMSKIGWFQLDGENNQLRQVSKWNLEDHLQVKLLDCHSNPPKYEWKLDATHYVSKGSLRLPEKMEEVSEMYKDISKYSVYLNEKKMKLEPVNPFTLSKIMYTFSNVNSFIFTASINKTTLILNITEGSGRFDVEITSPHWTDIYSFRRPSGTNIIELPSKNYDQCWVCVSQNIERLCQISSLIQVNILNENSNTTPAVKNETDCQKNICSADTSKDVRMIVITILSIILVASLTINFVLLYLLMHYFIFYICGSFLHIMTK